MKHNSKWISVAALGAFAGCGDATPGDGEHVAETEQPMRYDFWLTDPASVPITGNPFLPQSNVAGAGVVPPSGLPHYDANNCNRCTFTSHRLTNATAHVAPHTDATAYANSLWAHGGTGSLRTKFTQAIPKAREAFSATYASKLIDTIKDIKDLLKQWPGVIDNTSTFPPVPQPVVQDWFRGFTPTQTRMQAIDDGFLWHPDPYALEELRYRGARTYCAMREAARQQSGQHLSQGASSSLQFLEWHLGQADSTVGFGTLWKDVTSKNTNVFVIPILAGSKIAPISGPLVPSPGQIVHPVSWITADSTVVSVEDNGQDVWVNSQHADGFLGQYVKGGLRARNLPVFTSGFLKVTAGFDFDAEYGKLLSTSGEASFDPPHPTVPSLKFASDLTKGRVYGFTPLSYGPRTYKTDVLTGGHYRPGIVSDAPIVNDPSMAVLEDDGVLGSFRFLELPGYATRVAADDDRAITVGDRIRENLSVTYGGEFTFQTPIISILASVTGTTSIDLNIQRLTTIREHVSAVPGGSLKPLAADLSAPGYVNFTGQSNVVVIPETKKDYNLSPLQALLNITFDADIGIFSVHEEFSQVLLQLDPINLGDNAKTIGDEATRLRVGSFTDVGIEYHEDPAADVRSTWSHLPQDLAGFASFPDSGAPDSVGACINAAPQPQPVPGAPQKGTKGTPPQSQLCVYGPSCPMSLTGDGYCFNDIYQIPSNICSPGVIASYLRSAGWPTGHPLTECFSAVLTHLCSPNVTPPPRVQPWADMQNVIARSVNIDELGLIQEQCVDAFSPHPTTQAEADFYGDLIANLFHYAVCDSSWRIQGEEQI